MSKPGSVALDHVNSDSRKIDRPLAGSRPVAAAELS
jgi:hypothetical protein